VVEVDEADGEEEGDMSNRRCEAELAVTRDTANRDFGLLAELGLVRKEGRGRSTRYVLGGNP
jgi:predicted HTH transcriptional regulator